MLRQRARGVIAMLQLLVATHVQVTDNVILCQSMISRHIHQEISIGEAFLNEEHRDPPLCRCRSALTRYLFCDLVAAREPYYFACATPIRSSQLGLARSRTFATDLASACRSDTSGIERGWLSLLASLGPGDFG